MEKKKMNFAPFLQKDEKVLAKQRAEKGNGIFVEMAVCFLLWLFCIAADCFFIGVMSKVREYVPTLPQSYLFILIPSVIIHIVPFAVWMLFILKRLSPIGEKWYAVTNKRIAVVSGVKPVNVTYLDLSDVTAMTLSKNKIIIKYGEEKLVLKGLTDADALYDIIEKTVFPDDATAAGQTDVSEVSDDMTDEEVFADLSDDITEELFDVENIEEIEDDDFSEDENKTAEDENKTADNENETDGEDENDTTKNDEVNNETNE